MQCEIPITECIGDASLGRFTGADPISAEFPWVSTFNYAENEPIANIDLWGLQKVVAVTKVGRNSSGESFVVERARGEKSQAYNPTYETYADNGKLGKRGTLEVIVNLENGTTFSRLNLSLKDKVLNALDNSSEVDGGIMFYYSNGQGKELRSSSNAELGANLDELFKLFDMAKAGGNIAEGDILSTLEFASNLVTNFGILDVNDSAREVSSDEEAVDSTCNTHDGPPHGLPYRRFNKEGEIIDTVVPERYRSGHQR